MHLRWRGPRRGRHRVSDPQALTTPPSPTSNLDATYLHARNAASQVVSIAVVVAIFLLVAMGHPVALWNYKTEVNAIGRAPVGWIGVADPRRGGGAAGY